MSKYYCEKCNKYHYRGKIYKDHLDYKREKPKITSNIDEDELKINIDKLRPIAKRQLHRLFKKAKSSGNHELYKTEIIKLIKKENRR